MPKLTGVHETVLYAAELDEAVRFYAGILGLEPFAEAVGASGRGLRLPSGAVLLIFDPEMAIRPGRDVPSHGAIGPGHVCFAIAQSAYDDWIRHLRARGIEIEKEMAWPGPEGGRPRSIYFRDPAGNSVELMAGDYWSSREIDS
ncbi:MAG TPA: VOC family protein [Phycisphaerales bacterium]|nr:VOC family protein [Phycisphaerales bacterium]